MATTPNWSIVYPVVGTTMTPLANHFANLANSTDTALGNLTDNTSYSVANQSERDAKFPSPSNGDRVYRRDLGYVETWYSAGFFVPGVAAGWQREGGDSGWVNITPTANWTAASGHTPRVRRVGNLVTGLGIFNYSTGSSYGNLGVIPTGFRPLATYGPIIGVGTAMATNGSAAGTALLTINNSTGVMSYELGWANFTANPTQVGFSASWYAA